MFDAFFLAKMLHLTAMALMLGGTVINGLLHAQARRSHPAAAAALLTAVMRVNHLTMAPSLIALPLTGAWLAYLAGHGATELWIIIGTIFSALLILAYSLGIRIEASLLSIAQDTKATTLTPHYAIQFRRAAPIGSGALLLSIAAVAVMILKP